ncbi:MAG: DUF4282 domain-containing protein [Hyphomonadaceae bacterium]|nr:DUF4282 domain-containing protein [Hyphomonadaceae bacterium]
MAGRTMQGLIGRFLGFEKMIGPHLVKFMYYVGLGFIGIALMIALGSAAFSITSTPMQSGLTIVIGPLAAAVGVLWWRFVCELFLLAFNTYERLGEIRDKLSAQQYSQF